MAKRIKAGQLNREDPESSGSPGAPTCQEAELAVPLRMLLTWTWVLAFGLMARQGEANVCTHTYGGPNLARGRPTTQSSTDSYYGRSFNAVDGNCDGFGSSAITHTKFETNPWWSVDLGREYAISIVLVKNRLNGFGERLLGATIHLGDSMGDFGERSFVCGTFTSKWEGSQANFHCNGRLARFVTIVVPGRLEFLSLVEVEVYGTDSPAKG